MNLFHIFWKSLTQKSFFFSLFKNSAFLLSFECSLKALATIPNFQAEEFLWLHDQRVCERWGFTNKQTELGRKFRRNFQFQQTPQNAYLKSYFICFFPRPFIPNISNNVLHVWWIISSDFFRAAVKKRNVSFTYPSTDCYNNRMNLLTWVQVRKLLFALCRNSFSSNGGSNNKIVITETTSIKSGRF